MGDESVLVAAELLAAGQSERGGWSKAQLTLLGVDWPPPSGWKSKVIGRSIARVDAERLVQLRSGSPRTLFE